MVAGKRTKGEARAPRFYPAYDIKPKAKAAPANPPKMRASLTPGTIVIVLAGRFRGKRCVMLKALGESGLIVVSGPYSVNGVPIRRVNPAYVIATSTKVDVSSVDASKFDDEYFSNNKNTKKTEKKAAAADDEEEFFATEKEEEPKVSEKRKVDQAAVDDQLLPIVEQTPMLKEYLAALFTLTKGMKPHELKW
ncbi:hypothetical protein CTAYLR_002836 [Chrysophaeum taylorii]|uniref:60S ribosomal protein L6 n=1 Tax=Chrysophaeum taylorii TaxID=2483200 RepID=A0AAD7XHV2_9STRA|nr:hypothetical protein CTAYLR_002836 [Chrysophaeum taylorii]